MKRFMVVSWVVVEKFRVRAAAATGGVAVGGRQGAMRCVLRRGRAPVRASARGVEVKKGGVRACPHDGPRSVRLERVAMRGKEFKRGVHDCPCGLRML
ncbi:hypothetical protein GR157_28355 [Burkholderia sp. 4701]|nr:hypothetical protein [Burkholderia sp. 4701]MXN87290.1 hypothetical protein [Burkholderia sp. 4812]